MYSGNVSQSQVSPSARAVPGMSSTPSSMPMSHACCSGVGRAGANPTPQLPITIDVTPWMLLGARMGSHVACPSKCVWMSTNPGVTTRSSASISRRPRPWTRGSTSVMIPSETATSATLGAVPVPSTTEALRMTRSWALMAPFCHPRSVISDRRGTGSVLLAQLGDEHGSGGRVGLPSRTPLGTALLGDRNRGREEHHQHREGADTGPPRSEVGGEREDEQ